MLGDIPAPIYQGKPIEQKSDDRSPSGGILQSGLLVLMSHFTGHLTMPTRNSRESAVI